MNMKKAFEWATRGVVLATAVGGLALGSPELMCISALSCGVLFVTGQRPRDAVVSPAHNKVTPR